MNLHILLPILTFLLSFTTLAQTQNNPQFPSPSLGDNYNQIRNTLATYALLIDSKNFSSLSLVFTTAAIANYSAPLNVLSGIEEIETVLEESLRPVQSQHLLGTQWIEVLGDGEAETVTYYRAAHFGVGVYEGEAYYAFGRYFDHLILVEGVGWRIDRRQLIYMGTGQGNLEIFEGTVNATGD